MPTQHILPGRKGSPKVTTPVPGKFVIREGPVITSLACGGRLMSDRDNSNSFLWFLAGLGFGALMGVLYAPRSGRETRDALKNTAQEGGEYIKTRGREAKETVSQWVDRSKDVVGQQKEKISAAIDATRQAYREASEGKKGS
jgi:gas vesicle protein